MRADRYVLLTYTDPGPSGRGLGDLGAWAQWLNRRADDGLRYVERYGGRTYDVFHVLFEREEDDRG